MIAAIPNPSPAFMIGMAALLAAVVLLGAVIQFVDQPDARKRRRG